MAVLDIELRRALKQFGQADAEKRVRAIDRIATFADFVEPAAKALIGALNDPDSRVKGFAAQCIGEVSPPIKAAIPPLLRTLKDQNASIRESAVTALYHMGPDSSEAVTSLIEAISDPSIAHLAMQVLAVIGPPAKAAIPALIKALGNIVLSYYAAYALGGIGAEARQAVPLLTPFLKSPHIKLRRSAADALGRIGPAAETAVPSLMEAYRDHEFLERASRNCHQFSGRDVRNKYAGHPGLLQVDIGLAVWRISEDPLALDMLVDRFDDATASVRICALDGVRELGLRAAPAVPDIARLTDDPEVWVRYHAVRALAPLAKTVAGVVQVFLTALGDADPLVRFAAATVLGQLGDLAAPAITPLFALLNDSKHMVQAAAADALWDLGHREAGLDKLIGMLEQPDEDKMTAAWHLASIGPPARRALPALVKVRHSSDVFVRCSATRAIERIAGSQKTIEDSP